MRKQLISSLLVLTLTGANGVFSSVQAYGTLWVGNDTNSQPPILNVDLTGTVLRTIANVPAAGFAVDSGSGTLYVNDFQGMQRLLTFSLGTLTPGGDLPIPTSIYVTADKLKELKALLGQRHVVSFYTSPEDLAGRVSQDIPNVAGR